VDNLKRPQKRKGKFPDRDKETKQELTWYISFADEEFRSESVDGPDVDKQKLVKDVKEKKKKEKKERKKDNKKGRRSSTRTDEREETSMTEKSKGHRKRKGSENVNDRKAMKRKKPSRAALRDNANVNNNGVSSSLLEELAGETNERQVHEVEKENSVKILRQSTSTETLQIVKGKEETYTEKSSKQQDKKRRKRQLSPSYGTLDRFFKSKKKESH
jgi:hypothetical protein